MLFVGWQESHPACKKLSCWCGYLGRSADLHMAQLMPLSLTALAPLNPDWFYLAGFTFLVPGFVCVCVCVLIFMPFPIDKTSRH